MRVYFDASVIIASILFSKGGSSKLFQYIKSRRIIGITSQTALEEVLNKTNKIKKSRGEIEKFIVQSGLMVRKSITLHEIAPYKGLIDDKDAHIIAGAILTKCSHLVSLDKKHILREDIRKRFLPLILVSPKELLEEFLN
jgi:putative PIN family toxin of toxin-antitoxin system